MQIYDVHTSAENRSQRALFATGSAPVLKRQEDRAKLPEASFRVVTAHAVAGDPPSTDSSVVTRL